MTPHLCLPEKPASFSEHIHGNLRSKKLLIVTIEALPSSSILKPYLLVWLTLNVDEPNAFVLELLFFHGEIV